jgi:hypothetical protein
MLFIDYRCGARRYPACAQLACVHVSLLGIEDMGQQSGPRLGERQSRMMKNPSLRMQASATCREMDVVPAARRPPPDIFKRGFPAEISALWHHLVVISIRTNATLRAYCDAAPYSCSAFSLRATIKSESSSTYTASSYLPSVALRSPHHVCFLTSAREDRVLGSPPPPCPPQALTISLDICP